MHDSVLHHFVMEDCLSKLMYVCMCMFMCVTQASGLGMSVHDCRTVCMVESVQSYMHAFVIVGVCAYVCVRVHVCV